MVNVVQLTYSKLSNSIFLNWCTHVETMYIVQILNYKLTIAKWVFSSEFALKLIILYKEQKRKRITRHRIPM